ncbi:hypothetical protein [Nocardia gipuzkoensis]
MVRVVIPALVPPSTRIDELIEALRGGPRPTAAPVDPDTAYSMCVVGDGGRIHDRAVLTALDWSPGTRLRTRSTTTALLVVVPDRHGAAEVMAPGYFRVRVRRRREIALHVGDKVLLVGYPRHQLLAIHPPSSLHAHFGDHRHLEP